MAKGRKGYAVTTVFGSESIRLLEELNWDPDAYVRTLALKKPCNEDCEPPIVRTFPSKVQCRAYQQGLEDMEGWLYYHTILENT